jgi:hypothetical protein
VNWRLLSLTVVVVALSWLPGCRDERSDRAASAEPEQKPSTPPVPAKSGAQTAADEAERLAALWTYYDVPAGKGRQLSAAIYSTNNVDVDGLGPRGVRLVFRDHPSWGKSSYLVLSAGDFACSPGCTVTVTADGMAPKPMAARRPKTDEAIAMFINDARALWRLTDGAKHIAIEFPVKIGGTRKATFDVAGLDPAKLPGWPAVPQRPTSP